MTALKLAQSQAVDPGHNRTLIYMQVCAQLAIFLDDSDGMYAFAAALWRCLERRWARARLVLPALQAAAVCQLMMAQRALVQLRCGNSAAGHAAAGNSLHALPMFHNNLAHFLCAMSVAQASLVFGGAVVLRSPVPPLAQQTIAGLHDSVIAVALQQHPALCQAEDMSEALANFERVLPARMHNTAVHVCFGHFAPGWQQVISLPALQSAFAAQPADAHGLRHPPCCACCQACGAQHFSTMHALQLCSMAAVRMATGALPQCASTTALHCTLTAAHSASQANQAGAAQQAQASSLQSGLRSIASMRVLVHLSLEISLPTGCDAADVGHCNASLRCLRQLTMLRSMKLALQRSKRSCASASLAPAVAHVLHSTRHLTHLSLQGCGLQQGLAAALGATLSHLSQLLALHLSHERIDVSSAEHIANALAALTRLRALALTHCAMPTDAAAAIGAACTNMRALRSLSVAYTQCFFCLSALLPTAALRMQLTYLDISGYRLMPCAAVWRAYWHPELRVLYMREWEARHNLRNVRELRIDDPKCGGLSWCMLAHLPLAQLHRYTSRNKRPRDACYMSALFMSLSLDQATHLTHVDVGPAGCLGSPAHVVTIKPHSHHLQHIAIATTWPSQTLRKLPDALAGTLTSLSFSGSECPLNPCSVAHIARLRSLRTFSCASCRNTDDDVAALAPVLAYLPQLQALDMRDNKVTINGALTLKRILGLRVHVQLQRNYCWCETKQQAALLLPTMVLSRQRPLWRLHQWQNTCACAVVVGAFVTGVLFKRLYCQW